MTADLPIPVRRMSPPLLPLPARPLLVLALLLLLILGSRSDSDRMRRNMQTYPPQHKSRSRNVESNVDLAVAAMADPARPDLGRAGAATALNAQKPVLDVLVIGNGPSGLALSAVLGGLTPIAVRPHPDPLLRAAMQLHDVRRRGFTPAVIRTLAQGLEGRSVNPVALLFDHLLQPLADRCEPWPGRHPARPLARGCCIFNLCWSYTHTRARTHTYTSYLSPTSPKKRPPSPPPPPPPPPCFFMLHSKAHICVLPAPTVSVFGAPVSYPPCLPFPTPVCPCYRSDLHTWPGHGVTLSFQNFRKRKNLPQGSLSEGLNVA